MGEDREREKRIRMEKPDAKASPKQTPSYLPRRFQCRIMTRIG